MDDDKLIDVDPQWGKQIREFERAKVKKEAKKKTTKAKKPKKKEKTKRIEWLENELHKYKLENTSMGRDNPRPIQFVKFNEDSTGAVTTCVVEYINKLVPNSFAWRVNNTGVWDARLNRYRTGGGKNGQADVCACIDGKLYQIEIKFGRDKQSAGQIKFEKSVIDAGGVYIIAKDFTTFYPAFEAIRAGKKPPIEPEQLKLF